jgi:hypothetical protein
MGSTRYVTAAALAAVLAFPCAAHAQDAATRRQSERTEQANRDAAVTDEASTAQRLRTATPDASAGTRTSPAATLNYGPVLVPRGGQGADTVRKDPAEVSDEADTLARPASPPGPAAARLRSGAGHPNPQLTDAQRDGLRDKQHDKQGDEIGDKPNNEQRRRAARRHQAWQPQGPMAPRPLRSGEPAPAMAGVPIPPPLPAPEPVVPSSSAIRACQGIMCTDASGNTFNAGGNAGVGSNGRVCTRTGATVQCF